MYNNSLLWYNYIMALIHTHTPKQKPKKPNAKQRELASEWEKLVKKYEPKKALLTNAKAYVQPKQYVRETPKIPSLSTGYSDCTKKTKPTYTGTAMIGIGTLHKSNAVPIFSQDSAVEISRMRRG